jgi:hypothetical protein
LDLRGHRCRNQVEDTIRELQREVKSLEAQPGPSAAAAARNSSNKGDQPEFRPSTNLAVLQHQLRVASQQSQQAVLDVERLQPVWPQRYCHVEAARNESPVAPP